MVSKKIKKKILVVDDDAGDRLLIKSCLEVHGFDVFLGTNGQEALELVNQNPPDLIIMDKLMPRMDGVKACALLKLDMRFCNIPMILLTASADKSVHKISSQVGIDVFLNKPLDIAVLVQKIQELLDPALKK